MTPSLPPEAVETSRQLVELLDGPKPAGKVVLFPGNEEPKAVFHNRLRVAIDLLLSEMEDTAFPNGVVVVCSFTGGQTLSTYKVEPMNPAEQRVLIGELELMKLRLAQNTLKNEV